MNATDQQSLPAEAIGGVLTPRGAVVVVAARAGRGGFDVVAGHVDDPDRQALLGGVDHGALATFAREVLDHLAARTGRSPRVAFDQPFPVSASVTDGHLTLKLLDDGDDGEGLALMALDARGRNWGTGTGPTVADLRRFAQDVLDHTGTT